MDDIRSKVSWLEKCRNKDSDLFKRRFKSVMAEIAILERFVNLKPNDKIRDYWLPILAGWRGRAEIARDVELM